jgi:hypothetical protein
MGNPRIRGFYLNIQGPEWEPLFAYADAIGCTVQQASRELLMGAIAANASNAIYISAARTARSDVRKLAFAAAARAMKAAWEEMQLQAVARGVPMEDI